MSAYSQDRIAIIHAGRCGSTIMGEMLHRYEGVYFDGEIFNDQRYVEEYQHYKYDPFALLQYIGYSANVPRYVFAMKPFPNEEPRINDFGITELVEALQSVGVTHYILTRRENHLKRKASSIIANATSIWHSREKVKRKVSIYIPYDEEMLQSFQEVDKQYDQLEQAIPENQLLKLSYEEDIEKDPLIGHRKICDFIGLEFTDPGFVSERTNPFRLEDNVINYKELKTTLKGSALEWMLEV